MRAWIAKHAVVMAVIGLVLSHGGTALFAARTSAKLVRANYAERELEFVFEIAEVNKRAAQAAADLLAEQKLRKAQADELALLARQDPDADRRALSADSVRRIFSQ